MNQLILEPQVAPRADVPLVLARGVSISAKNGTPLVHDLNFDVTSGAFQVLLGPGHSPVIHVLAALNRPSRGQLLVEGLDLSLLSECEAIAYRRAAVNIVSTSPNLLPRLTLEENLELTLLLTAPSRSERRDRARSALELVGLGRVATRRAGELSVGTAQRASIARALLNGANLVLLDEPCARVEPAERVKVLELLTQLNTVFQKTIVLGTTDPSLTAWASNVHELASAACSAIWQRSRLGLSDLRPQAVEALSA
jgi:putative ABC transport system ATP-binding protein